MKYYIIAAVFAVLVLAVTDATSCDGEGDCEADECCLVKRFNPAIKGVCKKRTKEGELCRSEEDKIDFFGGKLFLYCNCEDDLDCVTQETGNKKSKAKCVSRTTKPEAEETTTSGGDGGDGSEDGSDGNGDSGSDEVAEV